MCRLVLAAILAAIFSSAEADHFHTGSVIQGRLAACDTEERAQVMWGLMQNEGWTSAAKYINEHHPGCGMMQAYFVVDGMLGSGWAKFGAGLRRGELLALRGFNGKKYYGVGFDLGDRPKNPI